MILELAILQVKLGFEKAFERDFAIASKFISSINGYKGHSLRKCMEQESKYLLLVDWDQLSDHTIGFRESALYQKWKALLHHYYDPFPIVEHYETILKFEKSM
jgi:heme-degrading monooxygenase HmoA